MISPVLLCIDIDKLLFNRYPVMLLIPLRLVYSWHSFGLLKRNVTRCHWEVAQQVTDSPEHACSSRLLNNYTSAAQSRSPWSELASHEKPHYVQGRHLVIQSISALSTKQSARHIGAIHATPWTEICRDGLADSTKIAYKKKQQHVVTLLQRQQFRTDFHCTSVTPATFKSYLKTHSIRRDFSAE